MIKVNLAEKEYQIAFHHDTFNKFSECRIITENTYVGIGYAYCREGDNFSYATGRKIALKKAISHFPREERKVFWESYKKSGVKLF
jgi:hypothetical protein